jgi:hypothetical protein
MRERVLYDSVRALLGDGETIEQLVHMWSRNRLLLPYALVAGGAVFVVAILVDVDQWSGRVGLALAGAAVAAMATTDYRVLVRTPSNLVLMRSSKVRQKALEVIDRLPADIAVEPVGSNLVITDWNLNGVTYSVMKRYQHAMTAIASR